MVEVSRKAVTNQARSRTPPRSPATTGRAVATIVWSRAASSTVSPRATRTARGGRVLDTASSSVRFDMRRIDIKTFDVHQVLVACRHAAAPGSAHRPRDRHNRQDPRPGLLGGAGRGRRLGPDVARAPLAQAAALAHPAGAG